MEGITRKIDVFSPEDEVRCTGRGFETDQCSSNHRFAKVKFMMVASSLLFGASWSWKSGDLRSGILITGLLLVFSWMSIKIAQSVSILRVSVAKTLVDRREMV